MRESVRAGKAAENRSDKRVSSKRPKVKETMLKALAKQAPKAQQKEAASRKEMAKARARALVPSAIIAAVLATLHGNARTGHMWVLQTTLLKSQ